MAVSANKLELLQIADAVAREKSIDRGIVIAAMEDAIAKAARARYGSETDVHAEIDAKKGELRLSRHMLVVELVENSANQISLEDARRANPGAAATRRRGRHRRRRCGPRRYSGDGRPVRHLQSEGRRQRPVRARLHSRLPAVRGRGRGL